MPAKVRVNVKLATYFFSPSLHSVIALGHQLLVEEAVEKMNLTEESKKNIAIKLVSVESVYYIAKRNMTLCSNM